MNDLLPAFGSLNLAPAPLSPLGLGVPVSAPMLMVTGPASDPSASLPTTSAAALNHPAVVGGGAKGHIFGRIQISLYYTELEHQLVVTVHQACDLPPRSDGTPRNPYVKMFLLPDRRFSHPSSPPPTSRLGTGAAALLPLGSSLPLPPFLSFSPPLLLPRPSFSLPLLLPPSSASPKPQKSLGLARRSKSPPPLFSPAFQRCMQMLLEGGGRGRGRGEREGGESSPDFTYRLACLPSLIEIGRERGRGLQFRVPGSPFPGF